VKISANIGLFCRHRLSWLIYPLVVGVLLYHCAPALLQAGSKNGFDVTDSLLPAGDIHHGGPARDGIPAIDQPRFIAASQVSFLADKDRVLGIDRHGLSKAYPIKILNYHEIVNDSFEREAIVVSYCPLCGTGMAFIASVDGSVRNFGVSGRIALRPANRIALVAADETGDQWPYAWQAFAADCDVAHHMGGLARAASEQPGTVDAHRLPA
jgi:hypothetical protein